MIAICMFIACSELPLDKAKAQLQKVFYELKLLFSWRDSWDLCMLLPPEWRKEHGKQSKRKEGYHIQITVSPVRSCQEKGKPPLTCPV